MRAAEWTPPEPPPEEPEGPDPVPGPGNLARTEGDPEDGQTVEQTAPAVSS